MFNKVLEKIKNNKVEFVLLVVIFIIACFLRFYNINDFLHFANDEARDAFVVKDFIEDKTLPLQGPETSIGHFHLGPIFYYLITPFSLVFQNQPVSGAILSAILGMVTIFLIWKLVREMFSKEAALISSFLYTISYVVILHSRWSWNPNLIPFFLVLYLYSFWKIISSKKRVNFWLYVLILALAIMVQLHASAFLLIPITLILFIIYRPKNLSWYSYLISFFILIIIFAPFIYYEIIHNWENSRKIIQVIFDNKTEESFFDKITFNFTNIINLISALLWSYFFNLKDTFEFKESSNLLNVYSLISLAIFLLIIFTAFYEVLKKKLAQKRNFIFIFSILLIVIFLITKKLLFLHYYIILFPLIFIFLGYFLSFIYKKRIYGKTTSLVVILFILFLNISYLVDFWGGLFSASWQKNHEITLLQLERSTDYIVKEAKNGKINLICEIEDYCLSFKYLLELEGIKTETDSGNYFKVYKSFVTDSLFKPIVIEKNN